jgi:hypothetical protein
VLLAPFNLSAKGYSCKANKQISQPGKHLSVLQAHLLSSCHDENLSIQLLANRVDGVKDVSVWSICGVYKEVQIVMDAQFIHLVSVPVGNTNNEGSNWQHSGGSHALISFCM